VIPFSFSFSKCSKTESKRLLTSPLKHVVVLLQLRMADFRESVNSACNSYDKFTSGERYFSSDSSIDKIADLGREKRGEKNGLQHLLSSRSKDIKQGFSVLCIFACIFYTRAAIRENLNEILALSLVQSRIRIMRLTYLLVHKTSNVIKRASLISFGISNTFRGVPKYNLSVDFGFAQNKHLKRIGCCVKSIG